MPLWSNTPPAEASKPALALIRVPHGPHSVMIVTSEDLVGCYTHFWGGRTVPCTEPDCRACAEDVPARWHAYLGVLQAGSMRHCVLETTAGPTVSLCDYRSTYHTLRGCRIDASRQGANSNARIHLACTPFDLAKITLPKPPDLLHVLATIWRIKIPDKSLTTPRPPRAVTSPTDEVSRQLAPADPQTIKQIITDLLKTDRTI